MSLKKVSPIMINQKLNSSGKKNTLTLQFPNTVDFYNKEIALSYLGIYYSWRNVSGRYTENRNDGYDNNRFGYFWTDGNFYDVTLPEGFYTIADINNYLQTIVMVQNGHYMVDANGKNVYFISIAPNSVYYTTTVVCNPVVVPVGGTNPNGLALGNTPQLNIPSSNNFGLLLGFNAGNYPATSGTTTTFYVNGQSTPNISPVTTINVNCNLAESQTSSLVHSIYQFSPTVGYSEYINITPPYLIFYDISNGAYRNITIFFTDQDGKPLDIIDGNINVSLLVRDKI
jgi:hypothetical protein